MESILSGNLHKVLVGANTGSLKSLGTQLFVLVGDHVDAERELIDVRALASEIEDTNLRVWNTTVEPGLRVWLAEVVSSQFGEHFHIPRLQKHRRPAVRKIPSHAVAKGRINPTWPQESSEAVNRAPRTLFLQ